jgi:tetraacyldisaccharide-1-P 4'-kinase
VAALSGLGQPASFEASLRDLGCGVLPLRYADHAAFSADKLDRAIEGLRADAIVTTSKDAVRLPKNWKPTLPVWVLELGLRFTRAGALRSILKLAKRP